MKARPNDSGIGQARGTSRRSDVTRQWFWTAAARSLLKSVRSTRRFCRRSMFANFLVHANPAASLVRGQSRRLIRILAKQGTRTELRSNVGDGRRGIFLPLNRHENTSFNGRAHKTPARKPAVLHGKGFGKTRESNVRKTYRIFLPDRRSLSSLENE